MLAKTAIYWWLHGRYYSFTECNAQASNKLTILIINTLYIAILALPTQKSFILTFKTCLTATKSNQLQLHIEGIIYLIILLEEQEDTEVRELVLGILNMRKA